eukprot:3937850-Rhodomonas_salina.3
MKFPVLTYGMLLPGRCLQRPTTLAAIGDVAKLGTRALPLPYHSQLAELCPAFSTPRPPPSVINVHYKTLHTTKLAPMLVASTILGPQV